MLTSVAFEVRQLKVDDCPLSILSGLAASEAVGAAGGGGGGGGGGGCFLWQAPRNRIAPSAITRTEHLKVSCFNFLLPILSAKHARLILVGIVSPPRNIKNSRPTTTTKLFPAPVRL